MSKRFIYTPKKRSSALLRISSLLFAAGTIIMWLVGEKFGIPNGNLLIMSGIAVLLLTFCVIGKRAEKKSEEYSETIRKIREECGKGDYNNDIFYD